MKRKCFYNAKQLVTPLGKGPVYGNAMNQLQVIENGALLICGDVIEAVGTTEQLFMEADLIGRQNYADEWIDVTGKIILPGFVDSHTHFIFAGDRSQEYLWRLEGQSYMDIHQKGGGIQRTVEATREANLETLIDIGRKRLDSMLAFGVTTVEGKSGYGLDRDTELKQLQAMKQLNATHPIRVVSTFMGAHGIPKEYKGQQGQTAGPLGGPEDYITFLTETMLPLVKEQGLADICDIFCEQNVFSVAQSRHILQQAKALGYQLKLHGDEVVPLGGAGLAAELQCLSAEHLLVASKDDLQKMQHAGTIATLLPITAFSLNEPYADGKYMIEQGLAVALATDFNPGSSYSENIPLLIALATRQMGLSIEATLTGLTLNGAAALGISATTGSLEVGKQADIVIHDCPHVAHLAYHLAMNHVAAVYKAGECVYKRDARAIQSNP